MKKTIIITSLFLSLFSLRRNQWKENLLPLPQNVLLGFIETTFVNHSTSNCIDDERWLTELGASLSYQTTCLTILQILISIQKLVTTFNRFIKKRLAKMDAKSPFNIEYNPALENTIKAFLKNRPKAFERLMAISEYYFPMFEEHLAKYNIPLELKYLAIVESALNPRAKSRVGASGLWQFMYPTGKQYNLEVTSYVDERYDPLKSNRSCLPIFIKFVRNFWGLEYGLAAYNWTRKCFKSNSSFGRKPKLLEHS